MTALFLIGERHELLYYLQNTELFVLIFSTVLVAAAGYIINDYHDVKIDLVNKPEKVVIDRYIKRRWAMAWHITLNAIALILGFWVGWQVATMQVVAAFLLWIYAAYLKKQPFSGNFIIALLTAMGMAMPILWQPRNFLLVGVFATYAFFISLIREIIKDIEDRKGDAKYGCKTLPIVLGVKRTKYLLFFLIGVFIVALFVLSIALNKMVSLFFVALLLPITYLIYQLARADTTKAFSQLSNWCKLIMVLGVMSMMLL